MSEQPTPKRRRGCLFYGCLTGVFCLVGLLLAFLVALHLFKKGLNQYTDTKPMPLPALNLSKEQAEQVQRRFENFSDAAAAGRPTSPLELTSDDLNALISTSPDFKSVRNELYVTIEDGHIKGQVSIPLDKIGFKVLKGRYFNGTGIFTVSLTNGMLSIVPQEILVKNKPLPAAYMEKFRQENLAVSINQNPRASVALNHLQDLQIKDGKIILIPKEEK